MALLISKPTSIGINAEYFKIDSASIDKSGNASVQISGFISKTARETGRESIVNNIYSIPCSISDGSPLWSELYLGLKNTDYFAGATDDL